MSYKRWVLTAILLFVIGLVSGAFQGTPATTVTVALKDFGGMLTSLPPILIAVLIFAKNASALLFSFILSPIFCLMPILALTVNGWIIANVSATVMAEESLGFILAALLPHGIIELPALILGEAAALSFGATITVSLFKKETRDQVVPSFKKNLRYVTIAIGLLLPAAAIETYVTPIFLR